MSSAYLLVTIMVALNGVETRHTISGHPSYEACMRAGAPHTLRSDYPGPRFRCVRKEAVVDAVD